MAITSQEAQGMQFGEGRRGDLDLRQVKEFQKSVVETLTRYEEEAEKFRAHLEVAEQAAVEFKDAEEAIKRTFLAASRTKREMIAEAARTRAEAQDEGEALRLETSSEIQEQKATATREAKKEWADAHAEAGAILTDAKTQAREAEEQTKAEVERLEKRLGHMRGALAELESRFTAFAESALDDVIVIKGLVDLETSSLEEIEGFKAPDLDSSEDEKVSAGGESAGS